jgi:hypothetical protein
MQIIYQSTYYNWCIVLQFMLTCITYILHRSQNRPKKCKHALWLFKCAYIVIMRIYNYCLAYSKDQCWHNFDVILVSCSLVLRPVSVHMPRETIQHCHCILLQTIHWQQPGNLTTKREMLMKIGFIVNNQQ